MEKILDFLAKETDGKSYKSYKYCFEKIAVPTVNYEDKKGITVKKLGETNKRLTKTKSVKRLADKISKTNKPLFKYFLDGSRRKRLYPIIAGQIGVGVCVLLEKFQEENKGIKKQLSLIEIWLIHFSDFYKTKKYEEAPEWDRVYITTLFTFYWKITVRAIKEAKGLVKNIEELKVGGVLASLLAKEVELETGIKTMTGLLDKPGMLDPKLKKAKQIINY